MSPIQEVLTELFCLTLTDGGLRQRHLRGSYSSVFGLFGPNGYSTRLVNPVHQTETGECLVKDTALALHLATMHLEELLFVEVLQEIVQGAPVRPVCSNCCLHFDDHHDWAEAEKPSRV